MILTEVLVANWTCIVPNCLPNCCQKEWLEWATKWNELNAAEVFALELVYFTYATSQSHWLGSWAANRTHDLCLTLWNMSQREGHRLTSRTRTQLVGGGGRRQPAHVCPPWLAKNDADLIYGDMWFDSLRNGAPIIRTECGRKHWGAAWNTYYVISTL